MSSRPDPDPADAAERECIAQIEIVRALKPLSRQQRGKVIAVVGLLLEAEELVPGVLASFSQAKPKKPKPQKSESLSER
jgi:hypothetical protein